MNKSSIIVFTSLWLGFAIFNSSVAQEQPEKKEGSVITIETTTIRGNQELPTVLYLVPWQPPKITPLPASQTADLNKQVFEKLERNSFRRLLQYHEQFKTGNE